MKGPNCQWNFFLSQEVNYNFRKTQGQIKNF
jgi:hypothetical protein